MREDWERAAVEQLRTAGLSAPTYRTARTLLDEAIDQGATLVMSREEFTAMVGLASWETARDHLTTLTKHGFIHYSTNGAVYVTVICATGLDPARNQSAPTRNQSAGNDAKPVLVFSETATRRGTSPRPRGTSPRETIKTPFPVTRAQSVSQSVDPIAPNDQTDTLTAPEPEPQTEEAAVATALLVDAGMGGNWARTLSSKFDLAKIRRALGWWWDDQQLRQPKFERRPGIVLRWLQDGTGLPAPSEAWLGSELYRRHMLASELAAEAEADAAALRVEIQMAEEATVRSRVSVSAPVVRGGADDPHGWLAMVRALAVPEMYQRVLLDAQVEADGAGLRVVLPAVPEAEYVRLRLANTVGRRLRRPVELVRGEQVAA